MSNLPVRVAEGAEPINLPALFQLAEALIQSGMMPDHIRNPGAVVATVLSGQELGLGPMASIRTIHMVKGRPVIGADAQLALLHRAGISSRWLETSDTVARLALWRHDPADSAEWSYTIADAKRAGLEGRDVWRKHTAAMLRARCISSAARGYAPEVLMGVYTPDEALEIDPAGYEPPPVGGFKPLLPEGRPWREVWAEALPDHDLGDVVLPFLRYHDTASPDEMDASKRDRVLARLLGSSKLDEFVTETRDSLRKHFCTRWESLYGVGPLKDWDGEPDHWREAKAEAEAKRHHVQRVWWGVDSLHDVTPDQALYGQRSVSWMRALDPDEFARWVDLALEGFRAGGAP